MWPARYILSRSLIVHFNRTHRQRRGRLIVGPEEIALLCMSCLARIRADTQALPLSTNLPPPSQHQYASSGHVVHQRVHHSQETPASFHPHQASQSRANANTRDIRGAQPPHTTQLQQYAMHGLSDLVDNLPPLLASFARRRGGQQTGRYRHQSTQL